MMRLRATFSSIKKIQTCRFMSGTTQGFDTTYMEIPVYNVDKPQTLEKRKASTFAKKYLDGFSEQQTMMYDRLINSPSNDWDIYYWIVQKKPTPEEFDNEIMNLLKKHAKNEDRVMLSQPNLH
ncbi:unnamed protein product [Leptidea sinapis]|uniref:Succinate dehydrogenase assembly factor 2, mitochondrial n=1 Tax=Leptidea sinapis TaxID=189913 RepID=A0A5E4QCR8_9NEOP|nr:unnamed protein product [Leptidea sinapis]